MTKRARPTKGGLKGSTLINVPVNLSARPESSADPAPGTGSDEEDNAGEAGGNSEPGSARDAAGAGDSGVDTMRDAEWHIPNPTPSVNVKSPSPPTVSFSARTTPPIESHPPERSAVSAGQSPARLITTSGPTGASMTTQKTVMLPPASRT